MIYTVTLNPSLDYIVSVEHFKLGLTNRTGFEQILPGGKGINVSIVLKNLGIASTALGFTAGFTGDEIIRELENTGISQEFIRLEEGQDYEITAALDKMGIRPNIKYTVREDRTMLAMVSKGLGISLLPELMVRHSPYPVTACHAPERFYRSIGIGVKDKKAMSAATRRFVDYVRQWVAENGDK